MKEFKHIAEYVRNRREEIGLSQTELSQSIGYKHGQFISNIERGVCSLPAPKVRALAVSLKTKPRPIIDAMVKDFHDNLVRQSGNR